MCPKTSNYKTDNNLLHIQRLHCLAGQLVQARIGFGSSHQAPERKIMTDDMKVLILRRIYINI